MGMCVGVDSNLYMYLLPLCDLVRFSKYQVFKNMERKIMKHLKVQLIFGICMCSYVCEGGRVPA